MEIKWFSNAEELLNRGEPQPAIAVTKLYEGPFPVTYADGSGRSELVLAAAMVFKVMVGDSVYATTVYCVRDKDEIPAWGLYCGDPQVTGEIRGAGKELAALLRSGAGYHTSIVNALEESVWEGAVADVEICGFERTLARSNRYCSHAKATLSQLSIAEMEAMERKLAQWHAGNAMTGRKQYAFEEEQAFYDAAFIQHVFLAGERGSGKTTLARQAADALDAVYLELPIHAGIEPWEFMAHDRPWKGKVYTVLGKFAEAARIILNEGKRVVLCLDEFLNMNPMYTNTLNTPLSLTANNTYRIVTGCIKADDDDIGVLETVEVPADMLWIVATSNIGVRYGIDKINPSVRARFLIILMNTNPARTEAILQSTLKEYGMPVNLALGFKSFLETINTAVASNSLDEEATLRLACNVIRSVALRVKRDSEVVVDDNGWKALVRMQLMRESAQVVNFDTGTLDSTQLSVYTSAVQSIFG